MRRLSKYPEIQLTLIDQHPYHFLQTEGYELVSCNTSFDETIVSLSALCANFENVTFLHRTVDSINPQKKVILLLDGICTYDTLIITLGSVTKRFECDTRASITTLVVPKALEGHSNSTNFFKMNSINDLNLQNRLKKMKGVAP